MIDTYNIQRELLIQHNIPLYESRGINTDMYPIIETLWEQVMNANPMGYNGYNVIQLHNIQINNNWLKNIHTLTVEWGNNLTMTSHFKAFTDNMFVNEDGQLCNAAIHISLYELTKSEFISELIHELHHAYRHRYFLTKDNETQEKEKERLININISDDGGEFAQKIKLAYYLSDKDEINARATELYHIIFSNSNIKRDNYQQHIKDNSAIIALDELKNTFDELFSSSNYDVVKNAIGVLIQMTVNFHTKTDNSVIVYEMFRNRLAKAIAYTERQNYKVISKALQDAEKEDPSRIPQGITMKECKNLKSFVDVDKMIDSLQKIEEIRNFIKKI